MKTLVETSLFNLFASYTNGAGPALGELPAAYDDFVNCLATLSPAGDLTGQLRCLNYTKIELAFMRQACNGMAEDCRNILYDVFIDKTLALLDAEAEILKEMLRHGTVSAGFHAEAVRVAPLNAACRAKIGDGQTVSSDMVRYGICVACCDMAPTLRNFNRLRKLQRQPMPLTGEQERIVSSLVARPDNVRFPNVEMRVRIPAKRKGQGMNI